MNNFWKMVSGQSTHTQKKQNKENEDQEIQENSQVTGRTLKAQDNRLGWEEMSVSFADVREVEGKRRFGNC